MLPGQTPPNSALETLQYEKQQRDIAMQDPRYKAYQPRGHILNAFYDKGPEVCMVGPSGTGKSRGWLEKIHLCMSKYPGSRTLLVRKTRESLTQSAMVTFEKFVLPDNNTVKFRTMEQEYRYLNGSVVVLGGMDKASKVLSSEYDIIYAQEATELSDEDWETLITRNRFGIMPYNQLIADCNPGPPSHWLNKRILSGKVKCINTTHEDNPTLWDADKKEWTERGKNYIAKLDALTGVRYKRLRLGLWAAAEGMIYDEWNADIHMCDPMPNPPKDWRRVWINDFGYTHPMCFQAWAISPEDVAYRFFEIYQTKLLVEDLAALIRRWQGREHEPNPEALVCDWDAEGRATLERHLEMSTTPANKEVLAGIDSVKSMLKVREGENGKPGIVLCRGATEEKDPDLVDAVLPTCTEEEIEAYEWDDAKKKEQPKKENDHGCDDVRYFAQYTTDNTLNWGRGMR